eukprot:550474_1
MSQRHATFCQDSTLLFWFLWLVFLRMTWSASITCGETVRASFSEGKRYNFTSTLSNTLEFEICQTKGSNHGILKFYQSNPTTMYDYCDDGTSNGIMTSCVSAGCVNGDEKATLNLVAGSYYVQVEDLNKLSRGDYKLTLTCPSDHISASADTTTIIIVSATALVATIVLVIAVVLWSRHRSQKSAIHEQNIVDTGTKDNENTNNYRKRVISASTVDLGITDVVPPSPVAAPQNMAGIPEDTAEIDDIGLDITTPHTNPPKKEDIDYSNIYRPGREREKQRRYRRTIQLITQLLIYVLVALSCR